jgi:hypothetical protein
MRKLLLSGVALVVCASAGVYVLARHACGRSEILYQRTVQVAPAPDTSGPNVHPPTLEPTPPPLVPETQEVIESIVIENRDEGVTPAIYEFRTGPIFLPGETTEPPILLQPVRVPVYMPYADEEVPVRRCGAWFGWLCEPDGHVRCLPGDTDCCLGWCTWIADMIGELWQAMYGPSTSPADAAVELIELPRLYDPQQIRPPFGLPEFREDPNYHRHYPSCPYHGGCPYPHHYRLMPPVQPVRPVQPSPAQPTPKGAQPSTSPAAGRPASSHIDTMECRPSDLRPGESNSPF